jgi:hypothetical protein
MGLDMKLPGLIIGGAPRSGTTWLATALDRHPGTYVAKPFIPEPKICLMPYLGDADDDRRRYDALFSAAPPGKLLVEKTSNYLENEQALTRLVAAVAPDTRFLFILREPVARAYSNYLWSRQNNLELLDFAEAIRIDPAQRDSPLPPDRAYARPFDYLLRNAYGDFAERWFAAFGPERVCFVLYEAIVHACDELLYEIQTFAGLDVLPAVVLDPGIVNPSRSDGIRLDPQLAVELRALMRPEVERFSSVTGVNVSLWGY